MPTRFLYFFDVYGAARTGTDLPYSILAEIQITHNLTSTKCDQGDGARARDHDASRALGMLIFLDFF